MAPTVMFSTEHLRILARIGLLAACAAALGGCMIPKEQLSSDFGRALHEDLLAQVDDPDRAHTGPPPPADGARVGLAMERYRTGKVIKPQPATASKIGVVVSASPGGE